MDEDNNSRIGNTVNNRTKQVAKMILKKSMKPLLIVIVIFSIIIIIFSAVTWFLKKLDTKENPNDPKNAPAAVRNYMNDTTIDENGKITAGKSIQELWDEMVQTGNRATAYLNSAEELGRLIYAARALEYPDTRRENVDDPIKWNELDINSKEIQGIVKFKRALADGENIFMTYVSPTEFQELVSKYEISGDEKDRQEALKHFTIEKVSANSNNSIEGKVDSLRDVVFMGDSILSTFNEFKGNELKNQEGAILMYKSGCNAKYFTGKGTVDNRDYNTIETADGHFDWDANFQKVTNPKGFYLMLGQNALFNGDRIDEIDELVKKIRSHYPNPPIYISSVLHYIDSDGSAKRAATEMNEELKQYCNRNNNVYFSDILRGYNDNLEQLTKSDNDHPNAKGVQVLLDNVKANIIGSSSSLEEILKYACSWVGKIPYKSSVTDNDPNGERWMDLAEGRGSDCSHFIHKVFAHFGIFENTDDFFSNNVRSQHWGQGKIPGGEEIGTDLKKASPGDVIWQDFGDGWHVQIYLGDHKVVECTSDNNYEGVRITKISDNHKIDQIVHLKQFPTDPTAYFDPETGILHGSNSTSTTASSSSSSVGTTSTMGTSSNSGSTGGTSIVASTPEEIAKMSRAYNNDVFNVDENKWVDPMLKMNPPYNNGSENREYRAVQSTCFDGKYAVSAQNKNYGGIDASSNGGRIIWSNLETGEIDYIVQTSEGGHMGEGITYDSDRNMIIFHTGGGDLLQIDNNTKSISGHSKTSEYPGIITYLSTTKQLVGVTESEFKFFKYDASKNEYVKQNSVKIDNFRINELFQGIGNDGQCIYVFDSKVGNDNGNNRVWVYSLDGKLQEEHPLGSGFPRAKEIESGFADNEGNLWIGTNHSLVKVLNYKANGSNLNAGNSNTSNIANMTYQVKVATWTEITDGLVSDDPEVPGYPEKTTYNMTTTVIPYQAIVSKYRMPFNYLWTMLVYSNDKDYTFDLADLVKDSKIEITVHDNLNETTNIVTDTYTDYTKINAEADVNINFENVYYVRNYVEDPITKKTNIVDEPRTSDGSTTKHGVGDGHDSVDYTVKHTTITKTNTLDIALTLADAWCAKYEKKYTYNEPKESPPSNSSTTLDDIPEDPYTRNGEFGCEEAKNEITEDALKQAAYSDRRNLEVVGYENQVATYQTTRIHRVKNTYTKITASSYTSDGGTNIDRSTVSIASTPKTGSLNQNNYVPLIEPTTHRDGNNPLQGFCLVGDDMVAYVIHHYSSNTCTLCLADINTMQIYDQIDGFEDHGNTIAYDSVTGDIIFPESRTKMGLVTVNKTTRKFENKRAISPPLQSGFPSQIAYNATHDLIIAGSHVYTRQAFYSGGSPIKDLEFEKLGNHLDAGSTSYGNHVYYYFAEGYGNSKGYFIVCDLNTGKQVEIIQDNMPREAEEASFSSDGTLYTAYAGGDAPFHKTDYNYFMDNNIDKSNISVNGSTAANEFARYNTGGKHTENLYFEKVFNSHYNARSNILSAIGWLYDALEQNEDTANMVDITKYLIGRAKGNPENEEEFLAALEKLEVYNMTQVGTETGGLLSITSTTFTREQFIQLVQSYSAAISKGSGTKDFRDNAGVVYDVCTKNNINPVLCAAQAWKEQNWVYPKGNASKNIPPSTYNYWGIEVYNGMPYGRSFNSMEEAVDHYCKQINERLKGEHGAEKWSKICAQYNNKFTGGINNLYDVLSNWACVDNADSNHPGQAKHASEYVDSVVKCATQIFGEGALTASGGGGDFLAVAQNIWKKICNGNYSYGGSSIPCTGSTVDCSSYVSWVLYEYGYTDFKGGQHCTKQFKNTNWNQKYGWQEINVAADENPYNKLQPGDLFVRDNGNNDGHITLVVRKENGAIYCYDCGSSDSWRGNTNAEAVDKSWMLTDSKKHRSGKIIRVTPKQ